MKPKRLELPAERADTGSQEVRSRVEANPLEPAPKKGVLLRLTDRWPLRRLRRTVEYFRRRASTRALAERLAMNSDLALVHSNSTTWVGLKVNGMSKTQARFANYRAVADFLTAASVPYFMVPSDTKRSAVLAVEEANWPLLTQAVTSRTAELPIYVGLALRGQDGKTIRRAVVNDSKSAIKALEHQSMIELFQIYFNSDQKGFYGRPDACKVQRWIRDSNGSLVAPTPNSRTTEIGTDAQVISNATVGAVTSPSFEPLVKRHVFEVADPVDVVYMWVDGTDEIWRKRRDDVVRGLTGEVPVDSVDPSRFRDNGELRYSLRSVHQHCEWVRNIILVTDDQAPGWLDLSHPRLRHVTHTELFGQAGQLPNYNSHAIASRLHHIDGLSDKFLIFNDDVFIGHYVGSENFFTSNGMSKFFLSKATLPYGNAEETTHEAARRNVVTLLEGEFGRTATRAFYHTPVPQLRSMLFELEERYNAIFTSNWSSQLRSESDYEINGWLHHYYGYIHRRATPGSINYDYFDLSDPNFATRLNRLAKQRAVASFCINDNPQALPDNVSFMHSWLEEYFPIKAPWELDL